MLPRNLQLKPPYPFVRNDASPQASGLILWWPGEPSMGGKLWDWSNGLQHGSLTGFANPFTRTSGWLDGKDAGSGAVVFDGTDDMVSLTTTQTAQRFYFSATTAYSVSFWIKPGPAAQPNATAFLLGVRNAPAGPDGSGWFSYYDKATAAIYWDFYGGTGSGTQLHQRLSSASSVPASVWTQVTCTRDNTNTMAGTKIYINGLVNAGTTTDLGPTPTNPTYTAALGLGKNPQATANAFLGAMEDVRIYNRALTAKEAAANFDPLTRWELRFEPGKKRYFIPDPIPYLPYFEAMEAAFATSLRDKPRLDSVRLKPSAAETDVNALASVDGSTFRQVMESQFAARLRDKPRLDNPRLRPSMAETDVLALAALELSQDRYVSADANELIRQLFGLPRSNFWKEPMQAAIDAAALMVANPEQEQSKFIEPETSTRALFYRKWLQSTYWHEPVMGKIDPRSLMLIEPIDAQNSQQDMQNVILQALKRALDRTRFSPFGQLDPYSLTLQEEISPDKYTVPMQTRLFARPLVTFTYGHAIVEPTLIPEDPPSLSQRSWYSPMWEPVRIPLWRRARHFFPVGTLDLDEAQRPETIFASSFLLPLQLPVWKRAERGHRFPFGDLGIDNADRPEHISIDEFRRIFDEPMRKRPAILVGATMLGVLDPTGLAEQVLIDKFQTELAKPPLRRDFARAAMELAFEFCFPGNQAFPTFRSRSMLAAGLARGGL